MNQFLAGIEIDELMPDKGEDVASLPDSSFIKVKAYRRAVFFNVILRFTTTKTAERFRSLIN